ncbi:CU044_5270 family protein [Kitasatospora griseola]|uniref:CU044_5270 family protein n=1 Tax=Kitasatospora griseola TaxID=2064 RepID=UPI003429EEA1
MNTEPEMLAADRHRLLKEHLMNEIARAEHAPKPRRKLVWMVASPIAAGAVAATALLLPGQSGTHSTPLSPATGDIAAASTPATAPTPSGASRADHPDAATLFARAADAVAARPDPHAGDGQFTYTREIQDGGRFPRHERKIWWSVDGTADGAMVDPTMTGLGQNGPDGLQRVPARLPVIDGTRVEAGFPGRETYRFVASLPTDPDRIKQLLLDADRTRQVSPPSDMTDTMRAQLAFGDIQQIFQNVSAPPAVAGALMKAAAKLPGTSIVTDQVDATGRKGVAVVGMNGTQRVALIFDPTTGAYLGIREVLLKYLPAVGPDGTPPTGEPTPQQIAADPEAVYSTAALEERIVNRTGTQN